MVSAPSGAGKTTICHRLVEKIPELRINVSHTTRSPREDEIDGENYHFVSEQEFKTIKENGGFLEWAIYNNNYYGTSHQSIKNSRECGQDILLELDIQGAEILRKSNFPGVSIFILPPSLGELMSRLTNRQTETEEIINQRIERGAKEIQECLAYDYIVTNHEVEETVDNIISIFRAEKFRASRFVPESEDIQELLSTKEKD